MDSEILYPLSRGKQVDTRVDVGDMPTDIAGQNVHYKWVQGVKIGDHYEHPTKENVKVDASAKNVSAMEKNYEAMKKNGVNVPIVADHSLKAKDAMGKVVGYRRRDGWWELLMQLIGDDALATAARNEVSVGIKPNMKDGHGNVYPGYTLEHLAITPIPVVPNQQGLLAASRDANGGKPNLLTRVPTTPKGAPMKADTKKRMMACLSASGVKNMSDGDDDDMMMSKLLDHHEAMQKDLSKAGPWMAQAADKMKNLSRENEELTARATSAEEQVLTLSRADDEKEPNGVLFERSLRIAAAADSLLDRGYDAAIVTEVKSLAGTKENLNTLMLSRADDAEDCALARVIDIMKRARPAPGRGEQAGQWNLSRENTQTGATAPGTVTKKSPYTNADVPVPVAN